MRLRCQDYFGHADEHLASMQLTHLNVDKWQKQTKLYWYLLSELFL